MISQVCKHCNNYFPLYYTEEKFAVENGFINLPFLQDGQYFCIEGSVFNDGIHQYPAHNLQDETFDGCITAMAVPADFIALCDEIAEWSDKNEAVNAPNMSPYQSESFGGYSYTKASGGSGGCGTSVSWKDAFRGRLNMWRKL